MKKSLLAICIAALPVAAIAQDFSYAYIDGAYTHSELDDFDADGDGASLTLSLQPTQMIYTKLNLNYTEVDDTPVDIRGGSLTVGARTQIADCVDLYGGVLAAYKDFDDVPSFNPPGNGHDVDGSGLGAEIGVRAWLNPKIELEANGNYTDLFEGDIDDRSKDLGQDADEFTASLNARFYATRTFSIGAGYSYAFNNEIDTYSVGVRYDFCCY